MIKYSTSKEKKYKINTKHLYIYVFTILKHGKKKYPKTLKNR